LNGQSRLMSLNLCGERGPPSSVAHRGKYLIPAIKPLSNEVSILKTSLMREMVTKAVQELQLIGESTISLRI
jgi:hypothetical protein